MYCMHSQGNLRSRVLRGHSPTVVRTLSDAHVLSERSFTRLSRFAFNRDDANLLVSSGPRTGDWSARLVSSTGHCISLADDGKIACLVPFFGSVTVARGDVVETARPSEFLIIGPGQRQTHLDHNYLGAVLQLPVADAQRIMEATGEVAGFAPLLAGVTRIKCLVAVARAHLLIEALELSNAVPPSRARWLELMTPLWEAVAMAESGAAREGRAPASLAQVHNAEAFMHARSDQPLSLTAIARSAKVGPRALQMAFLRHRRYTPHQFLQHQRLHAARTQLVDSSSSSTVTEAAMNAGFTHLGRFSAAYQKAFGEHPSVTRAHSRR